MCLTMASPKPGAAEIARARFIDSVKAFGEPGQILFRNSRTGVAYGDFDLRPAPFWSTARAIAVNVTVAAGRACT